MAKTFTFIEMKKHLYDSKREIGHMDPTLKVGQLGPAGQSTSIFNKTKTQRAKASVAALVWPKILNGELCVCSDRNYPFSYVEYHSRSTGDIYRFVVSLKDHNLSVYGNRKTTYPGTFGTCSADDIHAAHQIIISVCGAILFNTNLLEDAEMRTEINCINNTFDPNNLRLNYGFALLFSDSIYYGLAKKGTLITYGEFSDEEINDLISVGVLEHESKTANPQKLIASGKKEKKAAKPQPSLFTEPLADFYERCKAGEFVIHYPWSDIQKKYIVPIGFLDSFIPTESFRRILLSVWYQVKKKLDLIEKKSPDAMKKPINIKIMGKPGTGKTVTIEAVLAALGYPKGLINCKGRMEEDDIEGMNKFIQGQVFNVATKAGELHSVGGAIILEEANLPDPDILQGALGQALEYPFILKVDGYKEYKRHPLTIYFATMNVGTNGTKPMNEAFSSRFPEGIILEDVKQEEFVSILVGNGYGPEDCAHVYVAYQKTLNYLREYHEELALSVTLRHCLNALELISIGFTPEQAYEQTFISQLYSTDPEVAEDIRDTVFKLL